MDWADLEADGRAGREGPDGWWDGSDRHTGRVWRVWMCFWGDQLMWINQPDWNSDIHVPYIN